MTPGTVIKTTLLCALVVALHALASAARAVEPEAGVQAEIDHLLDYLEHSGCRFERNGTWHDARAARAHLEQKARHLVDRGQVASAEDFIDKAASRSSTTGRAYRVKCASGPEVPAGDWLTTELRRLRAVATASALPDTGEIVCQSVATGACNFTDPGSGLAFLWPSDWPVRRLKLVTESGPTARARQIAALRWIGIGYVPDDVAHPEATLFHVAVLPRSEWIALSTAGSVPTAVEVATGRDLVAVATRTSANPYPHGSRDADIFEALMPTPAEISQIVRLPRVR